ncbi:hypothetical protein M758_10G172300, partial [Ceratodon purpureus]
ITILNSQDLLWFQLPVRPTHENNHNSKTSFKLHPPSGPQTVNPKVHTHQTNKDTEHEIAFNQSNKLDIVHYTINSNNKTIQLNNLTSQTHPKTQTQYPDCPNLTHFHQHSQIS